MNFYDKRIGTPFMCLEEIYDILTSFGTKRYSSAMSHKFFSENFKKLFYWYV